uniref:F-box/LRR-repeat protein 15/At3g58940/PEG3-like LRR domain-containing protein n=1 Tax=Oryza glaberrima TaxID=4538 RepID=I1QH15_ORYGL
MARKGVQDLSLEFSLGRKPCRLPGPALFSCAALVRLDIEQCDMPAAPPGFPGFPNLERLDLVYVTLPFAGAGTQLEHLIVAAEKLAVLKLSLVITTTGGGVDTWAIRAPKLRELFITMAMGDDNGCRIPMPLPMLEEATISFDRLFGTQDFLDAFQNISTVNKLCFISDKVRLTSFTQFNINMLEGITCKFENLREACLTIDFGQRSNVLSLASLLKFAPHIEHLCISIAYSEWDEDEIDEDPLNSEDEIDEDPLNSEDEIDEDSLSSEDEIYEYFLNSEISSYLFASLKYVSLTEVKVKDNSNQMCFMKHLLSKARSLQTFDVTFVCDDESNEWYGNAWGELMECQKASLPSCVDIKTDNRRLISQTHPAVDAAFVLWKKYFGTCYTV